MSTARTSGYARPPDVRNLAGLGTYPTFRNFAGSYQWKTTGHDHGKAQRSRWDLHPTSGRCFHSSTCASVSTTDKDHDCCAFLLAKSTRAACGRKPAVMADLRTTYDVLICGGGPVGLLAAYGLQRMGISTCVIGTC